MDGLVTHRGISFHRPRRVKNWNVYIGIAFSWVETDVKTEKLNFSHFVPRSMNCIMFSDRQFSPIGRTRFGCKTLLTYFERSVTRVTDSKHFSCQRSIFDVTLSRRHSSLTFNILPTHTIYNDQLRAGKRLLSPVLIARIDCTD